MLTNQVVTGTLGALNAAVQATVRSPQRANIQVTGAFTGTVSFEGTVDGANWFPLTVNALGSRGTVATNTAAAGLFVADVTEVDTIRAKMTAYTSGSASVRFGTAILGRVRIG